MTMSTYIDPDRDMFRQFLDLEIEGPVQMLNLIQLNENATYQDGRQATGAEAYQTYGEVSHEFFAKVGGIIIWRGLPKFPVIGPSDEHWDIGFIAEYPSKDHFLAMLKDEGYRAIVYHRQAAVRTSRLACFAKVEVSDSFD